MSLDATKILSGGPKVYLAVYGTVITDAMLEQATIPLAQDEIQTITKSGTWTSGTYLLEVTYPDGTSETTATIALDATAATIKSALAALEHLTASDLTVTGGPLNTTAVVVTFGGNWADTAMPLIEVDTTSIVGGGTATAVHTQVGHLWVELPDPEGEFKETPLDETETYTAAFSMAPNGDITVKTGISKVSWVTNHTDIEAFNLGLDSDLLTTTAPGVGTVGFKKLTQVLTDANRPYYTLMTLQKGPNDLGWGQGAQYFRVKRKFVGERSSASGKKRTMQIEFSVFADENNDYECVRRFECSAAALSA